MRIPISSADLDEGRLTKIAKVIKKRWPGAPLTLMQAQNVAAVGFGYLDLHNLQTVARETVSITKPISRTDITDTMAWRISRRYALPLPAARHLVSSLPIRDLSIDAATSERDFEGMQEQYRAKGKLLIMDEAAYLMGPPYWHELTPRLLDAGVPPYETAVTPDRQAFRWSQLNEMLMHLPKDYEEDLAEDPRYAHLSPGDQKLSFILNELVPAAIRPLADVVKDERLLPAGMEIVGIFTKAGTPVGRVLRNKQLGGILPQIYSATDDEIFHAGAALLSGDLIPPPSIRPQGKGATAYRHRWRSAWKLDDMLDHVGSKVGISARLKRGDLQRLVAATIHTMENGEMFLAGPTFTERGQVYVRDQTPWIGPKDIPESLRAIGFLEGQADVPARYDDQVVPAPSAAFFAGTNDAVERAVAAASGMARDSLSRLIETAFSLAPPAVLSAYLAGVVERIQNDDFEMVEDDSEEQQERADQLELLASRGRLLRQLLPALADIDPAGLGLVLLEANNEHPSMDSMIMPPAANDGDGQASFLSGLVVYAARCQHGRATMHIDQEASTVVLAVDLFRRGVIGANEIDSTMIDIGALRRRLGQQAKVIIQIDAWRDSDTALQELRAGGLYLYVGSEVSRVRPRGIADYFASTFKMSRTSGPHGSTQLFLASQNIDELRAPPGQGVSVIDRAIQSVHDRQLGETVPTLNPFDVPDTPNHQKITARLLKLLAHDDGMHPASPGSLELVRRGSRNRKED
jgi:hypothetical protein